MDDEEKKARRAIYNAKYRSSEKGKAAQNKHYASDKYKATKEAYSKSPAGKAVKAKYDAKEYVVARKKAYEQSESGKSTRKTYESSEARKIASKRAKQKFPERTSARMAVTRALRDGRLTKLPCFICGDPDTQGHHPNYSAALDVIWLCRKHHDEIHR